MTQLLLLLGTLPAFAVFIMTLLLNPKQQDFTRRRILLLTLQAFVVLFFNVFVLIRFGVVAYRKYYMLMIQIPVLTGFWIISEYRGIKVFFTLLTTIVLCILPVEAVIVTRILTDSNSAFMLAALLLSYGLMLMFVFFFLRPRYLFTLKYGEAKLFWKFTILPVLYYLYSYLNTGYNFLQIQDLHHFLVNRIPEFIMLAFYLILPDVFKTACEKQLLENRRDFIQLQLSSATDQIEHLRAAQRQTDIYVHDLRHHINYLNSCLTEHRTEDAMAYIQQISKEIDQVKVTRYCANEPVNLILSSYAAKAEKLDITMSIHVSGIDFSRFQIIDICSLLSNSLENALKACCRAETERIMDLRLFEKNKSFCMKLSNSFGEMPVFKNDLPVSFREGHGIGVKSMIYVIEKYGGIYKFSVENGRFIFQLSM